MAAIADFVSETRRKRHERMMAGAALFAAADKSDPFALARAHAHIKSGVASIDGDRDNFYCAEQYAETRSLPSGEQYQVAAYKNAQRP